MQILTTLLQTLAPLKEGDSISLSLQSSEEVAKGEILQQLEPSLYHVKSKDEVKLIHINQIIKCNQKEQAPHNLPKQVYPRTARPERSISVPDYLNILG
jgi:hypothetical protein